MRGVGKPNPSKVFRHYPLNKSVAAVKTMEKVAIIDQRPLCREAPPIYCYCGRKDDRKTMVQCDVCDEHYHIACVWLSEEDARKEDFVCGYCVDADEDVN